MELTQINNPVKVIREKVEEYFKLNLSKKSRVTKNVGARYVYYKLCKDFTFCTLSEIGLEIDRHHTSVVSGLKQFDNSVFTNDIYLLTPYKELKKFFHNTLLVEHHQNQYTTMKELYKKHVELKKKYELLKEKLEKIS